MSLKYGVCLPTLGISLVFLTSCDIDERTGPVHTENRSVDLDQSEEVRVELKMGAGELTVRGGSPKLMDGEFRYNRPVMRPDVHYDASGFRGHLYVEQSSHGHSAGSNRWDVRLNDAKPVDLQVDFGAGEGRLELGSLNLRNIEVHMGVGQLRMDLRGTPKHDYTVNVRGGVGEATIYLPHDVGIVADATGGIGGVNARGLEKVDGRYTNSDYGHAKTTIRLDIRGGIGSINLVTD
jgi:hypothetical protein